MLEQYPLDLDQSRRQKDLQEIMKRRLTTVDNDDKDMVEILTNVPRVSLPIAFASLFFNLLLPGSGTMLAACST